MENVAQKIGRLLGTELRPDPVKGWRATIRGKEYLFPSLTHAFDAARHGLKEYEVPQDASKSAQDAR